MATTIHPTAIVEDGAQLGVDCEIQAHAIITRHCVLSDRVTVHPFAVIGGDPQYLKFDRSINSGVTIGAGSVIREHVTLWCSPTPLCWRATFPWANTVFWAVLRPCINSAGSAMV